MTTPHIGFVGSIPVDVRPIGSLVAVGLAIVVIGGGIAIAGPATGWIPGLLGMPAVAFVAWRMGPEAVWASGRHALAVALWMGARTILIADAIVVGAAMAATIVSDLGWVVDGHGVIEIPLYVVAGFFVVIGIAALVYLAGLAFVGLPILAMVVPAAVIWAVVLRAIVRTHDR